MKVFKCAEGMKRGKAGEFYGCVPGGAAVKLGECFLFVFCSTFCALHSGWGV